MREQSRTIEAIVGDWLTNRPKWHSAALHIVLNGGSSDNKVEALASAACAEAGINLGFDKAGELPLYAQSDLAYCASGMQREVVLEAITADHGINAIKEGATLTFARKGMTVVYGNNGSGKSGYSRLVRNSCTSRFGKAQILTNVYETSDSSSATYTASVNDESIEVSWTSGVSEYPAFPEVAFFDSECAAMEVAQKANKILFVPPVISALQGLAELFRSVEASIQKKAEELTIALTSENIPDYCRTSSAMDKALLWMSADEAETNLRKIELTPEKEARRGDLLKYIETDPAFEIDKLTQRMITLSDMKQSLAALSACCQIEFVQQYARARDALNDASDAAKMATEIASSNAVLNGFGSDVWKKLWEAARSYSNLYLHNTGASSHFSEDSLCPLCQQTLGLEASTRMNSFEDYVQGEAEKRLSAARTTLEDLREQLSDASTRVVSQGNVVLGILETSQAQQSVKDLISALTSQLSLKVEEEFSSLLPFVVEADQHLALEQKTIVSRLNLLKEYQQPGGADALRAELSELNCRHWIYENRVTFIEDARRRGMKVELEKVRKQCNTCPVSKLVDEISQVEVVAKMQMAFRDELTRLNLDDRRIAISTDVARGEKRQRIVMDGIKESPRNILSEGEQKVVALAGFFALLDVLPTKSTAVFDDPITSLDHMRRRVIARRMVEVAQSRPIVVFTHDPMFCIEITEFAESSGVPCSFRTINRHGSTTGIVVDELDWGACSLSKRIAQLRNEANILRMKRKSGDFATDQELEDKIRFNYSKLRSAWERAVEVELLNEVVVRAQRPVQTQRLKGVLGIKVENVDVVTQNMTKCSRLTEAHDDPLAPPEASPTIDEFASDVEALDKWVKAIREQRKKVKQEQKRIN